MDRGDETAHLKKVSEQVDSSDSGHIRVAVRVRPPNQREREQEGCSGAVCVSVPVSQSSSCSVISKDIKSDGESFSFSFDIAFGMECTQLDVFEAIGVDIVHYAFQGFNASLFAYGQTSSGKSFSMMGQPGTELAGLIPRVARLLFLSLKSAEGRESMVEASYMEIYNEKVKIERLGT